MIYCSVIKILHFFSSLFEITECFFNKNTTSSLRGKYLSFLFKKNLLFIYVFCGSVFLFQFNLNADDKFENSSINLKSNPKLDKQLPLEFFNQTTKENIDTTKNKEFKDDEKSKYKEIKNLEQKNDALENSKIQQYEYSSYSGSLMFDDELVKELEYVLKSDLKQIKQASSESDSSINKNDNIPHSFYLSSIIYRSEKDWTMWINNNKIIYDTRDVLGFLVPNLKLEKITEDYVKFSWISDVIDKLSPNWRQKLKDKKNKNLQIDESGLITFILMPNQTFNVYDMQIEEGFVDSKIFNNGPKNQTNFNNQNSN